MNKLYLGSGIALLVVAVTQFWPLDQTNPPERHQGAILAGAGQAQIEKSCFNCHSNRTEWPWYSHVTPFRLAITHHVHEGREELNFDEWDRLTPEKRARKLRKAAREIQEGEMPMGTYLALHPEAEMRAPERKALVEALLAAAASYSNTPAQQKHH